MGTKKEKHTISDEADILAAMAYVEQETGRHHWTNTEVRSVGTAAGEARVCLVCDKYEEFRGPGY